MKCKVCECEFAPKKENRYVAEQTSYQLICGAIVTSYDCFDCPECGCQIVAQEWISVKDRLPEESGLYITFGCTAVPVRWLHNFDKDIGKFGAWWNYEPDGKEHPQYRFIEAGNITHWMPLPQPPKGATK